jgi:hypothetical protein
MAVKTGLVEPVPAQEAKRTRKDKDPSANVRKRPSIPGSPGVLTT